MTRSFRFVSIAAISLAIAALATTTWAQGQPRGGRGGGFGGMGGSPSAQYGMLLNAPTVQKELNLTDDEKTAIKGILDKARTAAREARSGMQNLSQEERQAKRGEMGKKMQAQMEETTKAIEAALTPSQLERLKEIAIQRAGTRALGDKGVQTALGMTDEQKEKLTKIRQDNATKMRELRDETDQAVRREKMQAMQKETEAAVTAVLTDDQKAKFEKMKGAKIEIPAGELPQPGARRGRGAPKTT